MKWFRNFLCFGNYNQFEHNENGRWSNANLVCRSGAKWTKSQRILFGKGIEKDGNGLL
jgi:hypothetical protein